MEKELWVQCVEWLVSTGILDATASFRILKPADLASLLRDGVLLCELLLKFLPGCIDRNEMFLCYDENRKSPFMRAKNISLFLKVCKTHFGLTELFDTNDLYDLDDFARVLKVLSLLSHSKQAKSFNLRSFPETWPNNVLDKSTCENIYCNLREQVEELTADTLHENCDNDLAAQYGFIGTYRKDKKQREKLYDSILAHKVPSSKSVSIKYAEFKPVNERGHCLRELLDTESNYCDALAMIIETFYNKLQFKISADDLNTIFMNIKDIYQLHKNFLAKLTPAVMHALGIDDTDVAGSSSSDDKENLQISDVFKLRFIPYAQYCSLLKASTTRIDELERNRPDIRNLILNLSKSANQHQFKLRDLMVVPMQRILKYPLLLEGLIKTSSDISEQTRLDAASEAMKDVNNFINEMKRDHEKIEVINTVQRSVISYEAQLNGNFTDHGRLLIDGIVKLADFDEGSNRPKTRYIFLFEKMLIICKQKGGFYEFRRAHVLSDYELMESECDPTINKNNTISRKLTSSFFDNTSVTLVRRGHMPLSVNNNSSKFNTLNSSSSALDGFSTLSSINSLMSASTVLLILKTVQQRNEWRTQLKLAIDINVPPLAVEKGHSLLYKTYVTAVTCSICRKLLAGKFYQGYHCSSCNRDMHFDCCGLQRCIVRRLIVSQATNGRRVRSNSSVNFYSVCQFQIGDLVVCTKKIVPNANETNLLCCNSGDLIKVTDISNDGTIKGRLSHLPGITGIIPSDCIARTSDTLRKSAERCRNSTFSNSCCDLQTQNIQSPLVSKTIIALSEDEGIVDLNKQPWYFGDLEREKAAHFLDRTSDGTFLVRYSRQQQKYVISLKCDGREKHMKIEYCPDSLKYYLHDSRFFDSITELVYYYRHNNLSEGFNNLDAILCGTPLKGHIYRVLQSYERDDEKYLTLRIGDIVTVLETSGEQKGWWKGSSNGKIGFFPISFVQLIPDANNLYGYSYTLSPFGTRQTRQSLRSPLQSSTNTPTHFQLNSSFLTSSTNSSSVNRASTSTEIKSQSTPITFVMQKFCDSFAIDNNDTTHFPKHQSNDSNTIHNFYKTGNSSLV